MTFDWLWFLSFAAFIVVTHSLPTGLKDDGKKNEQTLRPKVKRAQELLMFGNQQNRHTSENSAANNNNYSPPAEKRTLSTSGLDDVKAALAEGETFSHSKVPNYSMERQMLSPHEKNYEYGKVLVNELGDAPRSWDFPAYPRYYGISDDRRKRSDEQASSGSTSTSTSSPSMQPTPASYTMPQQQSIAQAKRRVFPLQEVDP